MSRVLNEHRIQDTWSRAYSLHIWGSHEAKLDVGDVKIDLTYVEWLFQYSKKVLEERSKSSQDLDRVSDVLPVDKLISYTIDLTAEPFSGKPCINLYRNDKVRIRLRAWVMVYTCSLFQDYFSSILTLTSSYGMMLNYM